MSYNLKRYSSSDGWEGRSPAKAMETVVSNSPDIVGFQEVNQKSGNGWDDYLPTLTANGYSQVKGTDSGAAHYVRQDIFYQTAKFTELTKGTVFFKEAAVSLGVPNTESADESLDDRGVRGRSFTYVALRDKATGNDFLVVNVHLHYGGTGTGHEEDDKLRRYEIRTLLAWLETQTYTNVIVLGDMNSHYLTGQGKVNMKIYTDAGFALACQTAAVKGDTGGTFVGWDEDTDTNLAKRKQWVFDYIMTKGNIDTTYYTVVDNKIDNGNTTYPSDHVPVLARISFTA